MTESKLFHPMRVCCVCEASATPGRRVQGEPNIIAITPVLYRRGSGKGKLRNAHSLQVCEECLVKIMTVGRLGWGLGKSPQMKFLQSLQTTLSDCYSALLFDEVVRP